MKKLLLILTAFIGSTVLHGQTADNSLVFHKKKNPDKTFIIPFNEYPVHIKQKGKKTILGIIYSYNDSVLTVGTPSTDKSVNEKILKVYHDPNLNRKERKMKIDSLRYSNVQQIKLSDIDRIIIFKGARPGKVWIPATEYIVGAAAFVFWYSYEDALNPNSIRIPIPAFAIGYGAIIFFANRKTINLDKWTVAHSGQ